MGVLGVVLALGVCLVGGLLPQGADGHSGHRFDKHVTIRDAEREVARNVEAIRIAEIAYDAAFDTYVWHTYPHPSSQHQ